MTILDANILLASWDTTNRYHAQIKSWLEGLLSSDELVAVPWISSWALIRIGTNPKLFSKPIEPSDCFGIIQSISSLPNAAVAEPGPRHLEILEQLVTRHEVRGPRVTDAVLAAIAIEHGATLASIDQDFRRFLGLKWLNPLQ